MYDILRIVKSLFPRGPIWKQKKDAGYDQLITGIKESVADMFDYVRNLIYALEPYKTPFLDILEYEFGIVKKDNISEDERRNYLAAIKYRQDDLQTALDRAGYNLKVYRNDPVMDPSTFLSSSYLCYLGDTNAYCGEPTAICGEAGGFLIVNGDTISIAGESYSLPDAENTWSFVFWIAGNKSPWPILSLYLYDILTAGNLLVYYDYRNDSYEDYSNNNIDGVPTTGLNLEIYGATFLYNYNERILTDPHANLDVDQLDHSFGIRTALNWYHFNNITFQAFFQQAGIHNLNPDLEINSITKYPVYRYNGRQITNSLCEYWSYGEDLSVVAGTDNDVIRDTPGLGYYDKSILFGGAGSKYYQAANNTLGDITTEDMVFEFVIKPTLSNNTIIAKYDRTTGPTFDPGYWILGSTSGASARLNCYLEDTAGNNQNTVTGNLTPGLIYHAMLFIDKSGSMQWYVNGVASGSPAVVSALGSLTHAIPFTIGAESDGATISDHELIYCAMWCGAAWLDTHLQATLAEERFCKLLGIYPQYAAGTAIPTTHTRASEAYTRQYNGSEIVLHKVPDNWLRYERIREGVTNFVGYLEEGAATNLELYSEDLSNVYWNTFNCAKGSNVETAPNREDTADSIIANASSTSHFIYGASVTAAGGVMTVSAYLKAGDQNWARLYVNGYSGYFDVFNGVIGTYTANNARIEGPFYNGFYRCSITFNVVAGDNPITYIYSAVSDGSLTFVGDTITPNTFVWGIQAEFNSHPTSYIPTAAATANRIADSLVYATAGNIPATGTQKSIITTEDTLIKNLIVINQASYTDTIVGNVLYDVRSAENEGQLITACGQHYNLYIGDQCFVVGDLTDGNTYTLQYTLDYSGQLRFYINGVLQDQVFDVYLDDTVFGNKLSIGNHALEINKRSCYGYIALAYELLGVLSYSEIVDIYNKMDTSLIGDYNLFQGELPSEQVNNFLRLVMRYKPLSSWCGAIIKLV